MTKIYKKTLAFILVFSIMLSMISMGFSFSASALTADEIKSIEIQPITIIEETEGSINYAYNAETNEYDLEWFRYNLYNCIDYKITLNNETVINGSGSSYTYNGEWYSFDISSDQSYENQWEAGETYSAIITTLGETVTVPVTITQNPIKSFSVSPLTILQGTNGYMTSDYDWENDQHLEYYRYSPSTYTYNIEFNDGTILNNTSSFIEYDGEWYSFNLHSNQSYENQWLVGNTYTAQVSILGKTADVSVEIIDTPIKSLEIEPVTITEYTGGYITGNPEYYRYLVSNICTYEIEFNDGRILSGTDYGIQYNGEWHSFSVSSNQSYENQWVAGNTYTAQVSILGKTADMLVKITESPYESIEILKVKSLKVSDYDYIDEDGNKIYSIPDFTFKLNFKDGNSLLRKYNNGDEEFSINHYQNETPWTEGGDNKVTVSIGKISAEFSVVLEGTGDYEYIEQDGGIFITDCLISDENITVPFIIDNKPVLGIMGFSGASKTVKTLTLPDSVIYISSYAFNDWGSTLETLIVGKNINNLSIDMVSYCNNLREIIVSQENPYYKSVDGVVYNKSLDTLVIYPLAKGDTYNIPDSVTNIDVLNSHIYSELNVIFSENSNVFKTIDGVTYTADMKKVISCDASKTGDYVMPDTVTEIAERAFENSQLTSVTVSKNVTQIVYRAFAGCYNLENISLPTNLKSISNQAFEGSDLKNLTELPNSLVEIGSLAFSFTSLNSINIPSGVKEISSSAFSGSSIQEVSISEGVEIIGASAFSNCELKELHIPNSVKIMGADAFCYTPIENLNIGTGLSEIPSRAFNESKLTSITLPVNITKVGSGAFASSPLSTVIFENDSIEIGMGAFTGCPLNEINLGNNVSKIEDLAFCGNAAESVVIPESVTDITYNSFAFAENLISIDIPDNVKFVDGYAFNATAWYESQPEGLVYLENVLYRYKGDIIEETEVTIKDGTAVIADYAFEEEYYTDRSGLTSIKLPESLKTIGDYAFFNCSSITSIDIPANVDYIGYQAFAGCDALTEINVDPNNKYYTSVDGVLFNKDKTELILCPKRKNKLYTIPDSVNAVKAGAFGCSGVELIEIKNDDILLEQHSLHSKFVNCSYNFSHPYEEMVIGIVCNENSTAYEYALENLQDIVTLSSVTINKMPNKTSYNIGEDFDPTDLELMLTYSNDMKATITEGFEVSGFDSSTSGNKAIKVAYNEFIVVFDVVVMASASISNKVARPDEEIEMIVSFDKSVNVKSMLIQNITYDTTKMELVSGEWLLNDTIIADWDKSNHNGVANFEENTLINGNFFKLTFKIKEGIEEADATVDCDVLIREIHNDVVCDIPVDVASATIKIRNVLVGDVNGDDEVNDRDAVYLLYYTFRPDKYPVNQNCDFNNDGEVNDRDAVYLLYYTFRPDKYPII